MFGFNNSRVLAALVTLTAACMAANAQEWNTIFSENFDAAPVGWTYSGVQSQGHDMLQVQNGRLSATWDQANYFDQAAGVITPSSFTKPLGRTLTDNDTFQIRATIHIDSHTDNRSFYQIANFGLYNMQTTGPDRLMSSSTIADPKNLLEFNYFIMDDPNNFYGAFGPSTQVSGASGSGAFITGTWGEAGPYGTNTDMHCGNWLPAEDLEVVLTYFGALDTGDPSARRARSEVYQMVNGQRQLLVIDNVPQLYWTGKLAADDGFELTDVGFFNYAGWTWLPDMGGGTGTFDDVSVSLATPEPTSLALLAIGATLLGRRRRK